MHVPEHVVPSAEAVARTYRVERRADPFEAVEEYQRVLRANNKHPEKKSGALSTVTGLPRERIRTWLDGGMPDPARGIQTATDRGWFVDRDELNSERGQALAALLGWVIAGGSIAKETFAPTFIADREAAADVLDERAAALGIALEAYERERNELGDRRATEFRVPDDGAVFGRVLVAAGGPRGNQQVSIPDWLRSAPEPTRAAFVESILLNRGTFRGEHENILGWKRTDQPGWLVREYAQFVSALVDGNVTVGDTDDGHNVTFDRETTEALLDRFETVEAVLRG